MGILCTACRAARDIDQRAERQGQPPDQDLRAGNCLAVPVQEKPLGPPAVVGLRLTPAPELLRVTIQAVHRGVPLGRVPTRSNDQVHGAKPIGRGTRAERQRGVGGQEALSAGARWERSERWRAHPSSTAADVALASG